MSIETTITPDVVGLIKPPPVSRRGFMSATAAVAAGYTLAAGPVRAEVITTDTTGLQAGDAKIKVGSEEMPAYFARPAGNTKAPVIIVAMEIFGLHEYIKDVTRRLAKLGAFAVAPDYYFRKGTDLTKITDIKDLLPIVKRQAGRRAAVRSRRDGGLGGIAGRRHRQARHHRVLPRRPHGLGICRS